MIVVNDWIPTSNHNPSPILCYLCLVVNDWIPTSNHNSAKTQPNDGWLSTTEFLHQTTTTRLFRCADGCCQRLNSYIKPQHRPPPKSSVSVVNDWIPTSNHNKIATCVITWMLSTTEFLHQTTTWAGLPRLGKWLSTTEFLHQTTTLLHRRHKYHRCQRLNSYIKPQLAQQI